VRASLALAVGAAAAVTLATVADARRYPDCGTIRFSGATTHIVVLRGTTCATARRVARRYDRGQPTRPWQCFLAHAPFRKVNGRRVGFSCGYGTGGSNVASRSHAFVGTL
jgi:hypothetical protein